MFNTRKTEVIIAGTRELRDKIPNGHNINNAIFASNDAVILSDLIRQKHKLWSKSKIIQHHS